MRFLLPGERHVIDIEQGVLARRIVGEEPDLGSAVGDVDVANDDLLSEKCAFVRSVHFQS